jgi:hypothetical protein
MPFNAFATHRPSSKAYHRRNSIRWLSMAPVVDVVPTSVRFHHWTLGFRSSNFSLIMQALQDRILHVFRYLLLYQQALVPSPFRV